MAGRNHKVRSAARRVDPEITSEMVFAGEVALERWQSAGHSGFVVAEIYKAMFAAAPSHALASADRETPHLR